MTMSIKCLLVAALSLVPGSFGVPTTSASKGITQTATFDDLTGSLALNGVLAGQIPTIDFAYPGSTLKSFDVKSFYFGCTLSTQVSATVVSACTLQVEGTKAGTGAKVGPRLINFAQPSVAGSGVATQSGLALASFTDMTGLSSFTLQVVLSSVPAAQQQSTVIYLDDFVHTNYQ
ncbi:MAG: hypothetical protein M1826_006306 [Phylliscum demangeonii]|nr:MAG: hypothetical protein M1826_006306 [Phylliscum demangeonii]